MATEKPILTDRQVDTIIGDLLRTGVIIAAVVALVGGIYYLAQNGGLFPDYRVFRGEPSDLRSLHGVIGGALALSSRGLIQLGILLLIATPVARVLFSIFAFAAQRDFKYIIVTLIVLATLIFSLAGGYF